MTFTQQCNEIFGQAIRDYHEKDDIDTPISNPYERDSIENRLYLKCWIDTVQWHLEDIIRDPHINPIDALGLKRRIDRSNQDRTDLVEQIDSYFRQRYSEVKPLPEARLNGRASGRIARAPRDVPGQAGRAARTAGGPLHGHRPAAGRHRGRPQIHEGVSADEDVQRPRHQPRALQESISTRGVCTKGGQQKVDPKNRME